MTAACRLTRSLRFLLPLLAAAAGWPVAAGGQNLPFTRLSDPGLAALSGAALGAAWGDVDGDDRPDLAFAMVDGSGGLVLRQTDAGFVRWASPALDNDGSITVGVSWADVDGDGDLDLLRANYSDQPESLYRNDGSGNLTPVTGDPRVASGGASHAGLWMDYNGDGFLDLIVVNGGGNYSQQNVLFRGTADGGAERVLDGILVSETAYWQGAAWGDVNHDGRPDLLVANGNGRNALYENLGDDAFRRVQEDELNLAGTVVGSSGAAWGDYDNDGDLDLVVATTGSPANAVLYRNDAGTLRRVEPPGLTGPTGASFSVVWADLDNDGWLDLVVGNREGPTFVFRGTGHGGFERVAVGGLAEGAPNSNALAVADYDRDGDLDLLVANWPGAGPALFRNDTTGNHWLRVKLEGVASHRQGLGARVRVQATLRGETVWQARLVGGEDNSGSHEAIAHFGLGAAATVERVRVEWPAGGVQELTNLAANQTLVVRETGSALQILPAGGRFTNSIVVTLRSGVTGAEVRYTRDGSEPVATSERYTGPITLTMTTTLRARLYLNGFPVSEVVGAIFTADPGLHLEPPGGLFTNRLDVVMSSRLAGVTIRYTTDGSDPVATSPEYTGPVRLTAAAQVRARAFLGGFPVTEVLAGVYQRVYALDGDGIPAAWRELHFGTGFRTDPRAAADADPDGDETTNLQEFLAGTNPTDPLSGFRLGVRAVPELRFPSVAGQRYRILRRVSLSDGAPVVIAEVTASAAETTFVDTEAGVVASASFYVVEPVP